MSRLDFSPRAVEDLDEILEYVAQHNPQTALTFVASLKEQCASLLAFPGIGAPREELAPSLRVLPVGNYGIYYT